MHQLGFLFFIATFVATLAWGQAPAEEIAAPPPSPQRLSIDRHLASVIESQKLTEGFGEKWLITDYIDAYNFHFLGFGPAPESGQFLKITSRTKGVGTVGFALAGAVEYRKGTSFLGRAQILKNASHSLVQIGDSLEALDLSSYDSTLEGRTELLAKEPTQSVAARYRPLYLQGFSIGETGSVLSKDEILVGAYGHVSYGLFHSLSVGVFLPGFFLTSPNANAKWNFFQDGSETVSAGVNLTKIRDSSSTAVNLTIYWDSITSQRMTTHMLATLALATLERVEDTVAIKAAGSSSLQTGYELLMPNWDRVLFGPSYNFETKSIGGYVAYKRIWDHFHLSVSVSTVNIRELKFAQTGYVGLIEAYWRF